MKNKGIFFFIIYQNSNSVGRDINFSAKVCKTNWWKRTDEGKKAEKYTQERE